MVICRIAATTRRRLPSAPFTHPSHPALPGATAGPAHGLPDLAFTSFKRVTNYTSELTAADVVSAVTAQLEGPDGGDARHSAFALARRALGSADLAEPAISEALEKAKSLQEVRDPAAAASSPPPSTPLPPPHLSCLLTTPPHPPSPRRS